MNSLFLAYCLLVLVGLVWVVYRVLIYMRSERERESRWSDMLEDEDFKKYLKQLSAESKAGGDQKGAEPEDAAARAPAPPSASRRGLPPEQKKPSSPRPLPPPDRKPKPQPERKPQQPRPQPKPGDRRPPKQGS